MQTIDQLVAEKAGISEEQAKMAVNTVVSFLKERLPEPIAGQLDMVLTTDVSGLSGQVDTILEQTGLGGLLGR